MSALDRRPQGPWRELVELERGLLAHIQAAQGALQRIECLDEEQRAEIHTILEALKHDSEFHASIVGTYIPEGGDA